VNEYPFGSTVVKRSPGNILHSQSRKAFQKLSFKLFQLEQRKTKRKKNPFYQMLLLFSRSYECQQ